MQLALMSQRHLIMQALLIMKNILYLYWKSEHPEIIALKSYIKNEYHIVQSNFSAFEKSRFGKCAIICQTTKMSKNLKN